MKYGIVGTGALGGYYGGKLAKAGNEVHFLFRSDFKHVKENGLHVDSVNGDFCINPINCYASTNDMPICDVILVCIKTTSNHLLPALLKPIIHKKSLVVLIQNGIGIEEELANKMPELNIAGALAFICSQKIKSGYIRHLDLGKLTLGLYSSGGDELLVRCCEDFEKAGVAAFKTSCLQLARWQKLVWNIPFNGLAVVLNTTTDKMIACESTRILAYEMMMEVAEAASCCGCHIDPSFVEKMIDATREMTPYAPSMKLDFDYKRPMEIQAIYTNTIQIAIKAGSEMKKVTMLEQQLRFIQAHLSI